MLCEDGGNRLCFQRQAIKNPRVPPPWKFLREGGGRGREGKRRRLNVTERNLSGNDRKQKLLLEKREGRGLMKAGWSPSSGCGGVCVCVCVRADGDGEGWLSRTAAREPVSRNV